MSTNDFTAWADALNKAADIMDANPDLDPDGALRQAIWGRSDYRLPDNDTSDESYVYDYAGTAIAGWVADRDGGPQADCDILQDIPRADAIQAARSEARRFRIRGGGC